jgi:DNA-binding LacI/PurR family transcriptional regulator
MSDQKIRNMDEFAAASGISRPTISKYFNDPGSVRPSTRQRIEEAIELYDYRPNIFAMNQNRRLTKNIGIVVPYLADPFFAEIAGSIERHCIEAGYWPILFSAHGQRDLEVNALDSLRSLKPAGSLIAPLGKASDLAAIERFCKDVPTVLFDSDLEVGDAFFGSNNSQCIELIVEYLCRTGEPPCFLEMPLLNRNADERRKAYVAAMERLGHTPDVLHVSNEGWEFEEVGFEEGRRLIAGHSLPSSTVLCSNDRIAIGMLAAAYEGGMRVGHGAGCALRIAGHDDHPFSRFTCPPLTTVAQDYEAIAMQSVQTLFDLIDTGGKIGDRRKKLFEGKLVMRSSA